MQICFQNRHEQPAPLLGRGLRQSFSFISWGHLKEVALYALLMLRYIHVEWVTLSELIKCSDASPFPALRQFEVLAREA
ncbi:hypothetical protein SAMN05518670_6290 [Paenibacillus sp. OK076]|nr:hypothetical protein SAMN05518670_6290 [Paenibacillus sp. OK076]